MEVQIPGELEMRQAVYAPVFESADWAAFTEEMESSQHLLRDTHIHAEPSQGTRHLRC